jgi:AraC-like DNA-binding protein
MSLASSAHLPIPLASLASASSAPDRLPVVSAAFRREDGHAFERWLEQSAAAGPLLEVSGDTANFEVVQTNIIFPRSAVISAEITGLVYERTPRRIRADGVDSFWVELNDVGDGGSFTADGGDHLVGDGEVGVVSLGRPFVRRSGRNRFISLSLPAALFDAETRDALHARMVRGPRGRLLADHLRALSSRGAKARDPRRLEEKTAHILAACATGSREAAEAAADVLGPLALRRAQAFIDRNLDRERLPMDAVVRATGVSRATLYRLFTPYGGLARFTWMRRLERARGMISAAEGPPRLADISDAVGFTSPAHFSSAFKAHFGVRPSELVFATR